MSNVTAKPAPPLNIPSSDNTVTVKVVNSTADIKGSAKPFVTPLIGELERLEFNAFVFLIENPRTNQTILFDLAVRGDFFNTAPPPMTDRVQRLGFEVNVEKDVPIGLVEEGLDLNGINSVIWSHVHWDHTGNLSAFPESTEVVVGPGFKKNFMPGYPANKEGKFLEEDYKGRQMREISFDQGHTVADFPAFDFFGDGSFYLLDAPGHEIGHICGFARVTPTTFILMGADAAHFPGLLRPSPYHPLPEHIDTSNMRRKDAASDSQAYLDIHPEHDRTKPFQKLAADPDGSSAANDPDKAKETIQKLIKIDASNDVLVLFAHDKSIAHIMDYLPASINDWKARGLKQKFFWNFLSAFGLQHN